MKNNKLLISALLAFSGNTRFPGHAYGTGDRPGRTQYVPRRVPQTAISAKQFQMVQTCVWTIFRQSDSADVLYRHHRLAFHLCAGFCHRKIQRSFNRRKQSNYPRRIHVL